MRPPLSGLKDYPATPVRQGLDSGAERSTVQTVPWGCLPSPEKLQVIGAKGEPFKVLVIKGVEIEAPSRIGIGSFLLVSEAEYN